MAIETIDNFGIFVGKNIDSRYGPYADETEANGAINSIFRFKGLTVLITGSGTQIEYWYNPTVADEDLVPKTATNAGTGLSVAATASFTNSTIWNFTHDLQSRYVVIQALDLNHQQIIPETIELIDTSSARLTFPTPESGYAIATIGGTTASVALTATSVLTNNGGKIYDIGNDLIIQPFNNLIISGNIIPGPPYTANTSSYNLGSPTAAWNRLYVANGSVVFITGSSIADLRYTGTHIAATTPFTGSFTGSLFGTGPSSFSESITLTGSLNITGSTIQTGNNNLIGNTTLSGSIGISGSSTIQGTTTMTGSLNISGSTTLSGSTNFSGTHILSGSNTIIGNTVLSGSIEVSGSSNFHNSIFIVTGSTFIKGLTNISGSTNITGSFNVVDGNINVVSGSSFTRWGNKLFNYGQFSSTTTQSGSANTAYSMTFDTTDFSNGVSLVDGSKLTIANTGLYNIQFSAQLHTTANQAVDFSIWFAMTGSNIANSNTDFSIEKINGGGFQVAALNFLTQIASGSYVELKYSKTTANGQLQSKGIQASPTRPATPSVILTVTQVA